MKKVFLSLFVVVNLAATTSLFAQNNQGNQGDQGNQNNQGNFPVFIPGSTIENQGDQGNMAHTNHVISLRSPGGAPATPAGYGPSQLAAAYSFTPGGSGTIAIVDAYHYPTAYSDLTTFSKQFSGLRVLPQCTSTNPLKTAPCFAQVYATGRQPKGNCGWNQEAALDIEWAHAMAPNASIVLVEAASASYTDLFNAVQVAANIVNANGAGEVSMSWGGSEFNGETSYDSIFLKTNVVYFAASGDTGGQTIYPSVSPNVVAAGGTSLIISPTLKETAWSGSGGGPSKYESRPTYQNNINSIVGLHRGVPDFSFDADPNTGVAVYDSTSCQGWVGWMVFGGTSVASPSLAGIVNSAGTFSSNTTNELTLIYSNLINDVVNSNFRDITSGTAGSYTAKAGWDFVTGVGSSVGRSGK